MQWNLDFMAKSDEGMAYADLAQRVDEAVEFMLACGMDERAAVMRETEFYVSHEALLLDYEQALTRQDSTTGLWYAAPRGSSAVGRLHRLPTRSRRSLKLLTVGAKCVNVWLEPHSFCLKSDRANRLGLCCFR